MAELGAHPCWGCSGCLGSESTWGQPEEQGVLGKGRADGKGSACTDMVPGKKCGSVTPVSSGCGQNSLLPCSLQPVLSTAGCSSHQQWGWPRALCHSPWKPGAAG